MPLIHEVLPVGPLRCNCSILGDSTSLEAIVIDPGDDIPRILTLLARHSLTVQHILITHAHIDHIAGAHQLRQLTGAPILYNPADLPLVAMMSLQADWFGVPTPEVHPPDHAVHDLEPISLPNLTGTILFTPGHTEGSLCLHLPEHSLLLAGDTLFAGSVGRTDLPGGDSRKLIASIKSRLLTLPESTRVLPGHGPATTIGQEADSNPFLQTI